MMKHLVVKLSLLAVFGFMCLAGGPLPAANNDIVYRVAVKMIKAERTPALDEEKKVRARRLWGDGMIDTSWVGNESGFGVVLTNKTDKDLTITWQKSWLIDETGKKRVIVPPSRLAGKTKNTQVSVIPARKKTQLTVMPQDYIKDQGPPVSIMTGMPVSTKTSWKFPVFKQTYKQKEIKKITKKQKKKHPGDFDFVAFVEEKTLEVVLNMDINGAQYTYHFYFQPYIFNK
jgi:hypothetical protein